MKKENIFSRGKIRKVSANYFTGPVYAREISKVNSQEHKIYHVTFKKGTITKLHHHQGGQTLIVTKGNGKLSFYKKIGKGRSKFKIKKIKTMPLNVGDVAYIPGKVLHTHGSSSKKRDFSHIAINSSPIKNKEPKTTWFESDFKSTVSKTLK
ncbi:MAG TPA: cupin domain-containing protein [Nitrosopumilaceae archaeon]|nr:cupin domain-containing protein [Nitrosopumilaceae archaeon]